MAAETNLVNRIADPKGIYQAPDPRKYYDSIDHYVNYLSTLPDTARDQILFKQMGMHQSPTGMQGMEHNNSVEFPYSFPSPGKYRIWVQVKRNGQILTAAFDKEVE